MKVNSSQLPVSLFQRNHRTRTAHLFIAIQVSTSKSAGTQEHKCPVCTFALWWAQPQTVPGEYHLRRVTYVSFAVASHTYVCLRLYAAYSIGTGDTSYASESLKPLLTDSVGSSLMARNRLSHNALAVSNILHAYRRTVQDSHAGW
eukprot:m.65323 g.65323  ORF g.65323 m.65323 type:complete len:146 (-) comp12051_c0_seq4:1732-2169(-)